MRNHPSFFININRLNNARQIKIVRLGFRVYDKTMFAGPNKIEGFRKDFDMAGLTIKNTTKKVEPDFKPRAVLPPNKVEIDKKTKSKNPRKFDKHKKKIRTEGEMSKFDMYLSELNEDTSEGTLFVVYASNKRGRGNGSAVVMAKSKADAKRIMKDSDWLEQATIDSVESADEAYDILDDAELETFKKMKLGKWKELEWGT